MQRLFLFSGTTGQWKYLPTIFQPLHHPADAQGLCGSCFFRDHRLRHNINQRLDIEGSHHAFFFNLVCFKREPACFHHCFLASVFLCEEVYWKAIMFASSFHRTVSHLIIAVIKWSKNMTTTSKEYDSLIILQFMSHAPQGPLVRRAALTNYERL